MRADGRAKKLFNLRIAPAVLLGVIGGICSYILTDAQWLAAVAAMLPAIAAAVAFALRKKSVAVFFVCLTTGAMIGIAGAAVNVAVIRSRAFFAEAATVTARVQMGNASELDGTVETDYFIVDDIVVDGVALDGKAQVYMSYDGEKGLREGDVITFTATDVGTHSDVGDGFDANDLSQGIYYYIVADTSAAADGQSPYRKEGSRFDVLDKVRLAVANALSENMHEDTAEFVYAMLFGYDDVMSDDVRTQFQSTGTAHLLAVSGLHVVMLAAAANWFLKKLRLNRYLRFSILVAVLLAFSALCGFSASVVRSFVMIVIYEIGNLVGGRYDPLSSLSLSAALTLPFTPYSLFTLGFLMSYAAVFGIVLFNEPIEKGLRKLKVPRALATAIATSVAANIGVLPITVQTFGSTSLIFLLANLIVVPLVTFAFPIFLVALPIGMIPYMGWVLSAVSLFFTAMIYLVDACAKIHFASINFSLDWYQFVIYFALLTLVSRYSFVQMQSKKILASVLIICFCVNVTAQSFDRWIYPNRMICLRSDEAAGAVFVGGGNAYIVADGEIDYDFVVAARDILDREVFESLTFVKKDLNDYETRLLSSVLAGMGVERVVTMSDADAPHGMYFVRAMTDENAAALFYDEGLVFYFGGAQVFLGETYGSLNAARSDVVITLEDLQPLGKRQIVVSDAAYARLGENSVPSDFTFGLNSGKIKKIAKWSFV